MARTLNGHLTGINEHPDWLMACCTKKIITFKNMNSTPSAFICIKSFVWSINITMYFWPQIWDVQLKCYTLYNMCNYILPLFLN